MRKIWISSALCATILLMSGCSNSKTTVQNTTLQVSTQNSTTIAANRDLTLEQLKKYDGQNENPAYVAVGGTIYDVTNAKDWKNGKHKNGVTAGKDLSVEIDSAPHGRDVLSNLTVVGKIK